MRMSEYSIQQIMEAMPGAFLQDQAGTISATVQFHFTGNQASDWFVRINDGACSSSEGTTPDPNVTMTVDSDDFLAILTGKLEPMAAFMRGKLNMRGDVSLAMKLPKLFKSSTTG